MSRFIKCDADSGVHGVAMSMMEKHFPQVEVLSIGYLFDTEKKISRGLMRLAEMVKPNKLLSHFALDREGSPFDFIMVIDKMAWETMDEPDKVRLIRHELRHISFNDKGAPCLVTHDFQDFYREVELNSDAPDWCRRVCEITLVAYTQDKKKGEKAARKTIANATFDLDAANGRGNRPQLQAL